MQPFSFNYCTDSSTKCTNFTRGTGIREVLNVARSVTYISSGLNWQTAWYWIGGQEKKDLRP